MKLSELINPTERQTQFLQALKDKKKFILYGGAAGGGKSYILRWANIAYLLDCARKGHRNVRVGLFCEDYPALKDRHLDKIRFEIPSWLGTYRGTDHNFVLADRFGGGVISFRNLDDVSKYLSAEFAAISVDELTRNGIEIFNFLRMRLRWPGIEYNPFMGATNPGSRGNGWVKMIWIDKQLPPEIEAFYGADDFAFIPAMATDNPHLTESYYIALSSLPEKLRKAYKEGNWDVFEGQVFTEFDQNKHVVDDFEIPASWPRFRSMDWGFTHPYAVYWHAVDYDGVIWTYRELYGWGGTPNVGSQEIASDVAKKIVAIEAEAEETISYGVADTQIWDRIGGSGKTIAEDFTDAGIHWTKAQKEPGSNIQGKMQVHNRLRGWNYDTPQWKPAWQIFRSCKHLIRTLPNLVYDENRAEEVSRKQENHSYDAVKYFFRERPFTPIQLEKPKPRDSYAYDDETEGDSGWMGV